MDSRIGRRPPYNPCNAGCTARFPIPVNLIIKWNTEKLPRPHAQCFKKVANSIPLRKFLSSNLPLSEVMPQENQDLSTVLLATIKKPLVKIGSSNTFYSVTITGHVATIFNEPLVQTISIATAFYGPLLWPLPFSPEFFYLGIKYPAPDFRPKIKQARMLFPSLVLSLVSKHHSSKQALSGSTFDDPNCP